MDLNQKKAINAIRNYLNKDFSDDYILNKYGYVVDELIEKAENFKKVQPVDGVSSCSQGPRSISFKDNASAWTITDDIKALLPTPYCKMC